VGAGERELRGHTKGVRCCAWSPDASRLASASLDNTVRVWHVGDAAPREAAALQGHLFSVHSCAWRPDGRRLASSSSDNTVRVWDVDTGREEAKLEGHDGRVFSCAWSPDGAPPRRATRRCGCGM